MKIVAIATATMVRSCRPERPGLFLRSILERRLALRLEGAAEQRDRGNNAPGSGRKSSEASLIRVSPKSISLESAAT
jgi:hypothetical protein